MELNKFRNNYGLIRLLLSAFVIISHSYPLSGEIEIVSIWVNNQFDLGIFAVNCFFILSGYLIHQSIQRSNSVRGYMWRRVLRVFPGLCVALLLTVCILAIIYYETKIWRSLSFWTYFPNCISLYNVQYNIQGVFTENPYPKTINGSLWSLRYEFTMYLLFLVLFLFKKNKKFNIIFILTGFFISYILFNFRPYTLGNFLHSIFLKASEFYRLSMYFFLGAILSLIDLKKYNTAKNRFVLLFILILSVYYNKYDLVGVFCLGPLLIMVGNLYIKGIGDIDNKIGDWSYGLYIYGFFIQQLIMHFSDLNTFGLIFMSLLLTSIIAYLSWHMIEKRALRFKNVIN